MFYIYILICARGLLFLILFQKASKKLICLIPLSGVELSVKSWITCFGLSFSVYEVARFKNMFVCYLCQAVEVKRGNCSQLKLSVGC